MSLTCPNYETRSEYRMVKIGGDVVGMSTVPVYLQHSLQMSLALSAVTNIAKPDTPETTAGSR